MPKRAGIRIWRFRNGVWQYRTSSTERADQDLPKERVASQVEPRADHWLVQAVPEDSYNKKVDQISQKDIIAAFPDSRIPKDGDVWHWDGDKLSRVYVRSARVDQEDRVDEVAAALGGYDADDELVIFFRGVGQRCFVYDCTAKTWEDAELEEESGSLQLAASGSENERILDSEEELLILLTRRLTNSQSDIKRALEAARQGDNETAAQIVGGVVLEVITGAEPAPIQGHNVAHSLPSVIDGIEKLDALVKERETLAQASASNRSGFTGDFGTGVGLVDGTWQAVGSLVAFFKSFKDIYQMHGLSKEDRQAKHGHAARKRELLNIGTHAIKSSSTIAAAIEAMGKVAAFSTAVPAPMVPVAGALTGLIATVRSSVQAEKSRRRMAKLKRLLEKNNGTLDYEVQRLLAYAMRKSKRKFAGKTAEATTAAFGTVGSTILIVGAIVAGANAWNPVGWGIGIAVFIAGAGLLTYKIVRKVTSASRADKRGFSRSEFPLKLLNEYRRQFGRDPYSSETIVLHDVLSAYGVRGLDILTSPTEEVARAIDRIARHMK